MPGSWPVRRKAERPASGSGLDQRDHQEETCPLRRCACEIAAAQRKRWAKQKKLRSRSRDLPRNDLQWLQLQQPLPLLACLARPCARVIEREVLRPVPERLPAPTITRECSRQVVTRVTKVRRQSYRRCPVGDRFGEEAEFFEHVSAYRRARAHGVEAEPTAVL